jgi:hypothetical protein
MGQADRPKIALRRHCIFSKRNTSPFRTPGATMSTLAMYNLLSTSMATVDLCIIGATTLRPSGVRHVDEMSNKGLCITSL